MNKMNKKQLRRLFLRNYGAAATLARDMGLSRTTISKWFQGHVSSRRIEEAVRTRALELIRSEQPLAVKPASADLLLDY